MGLLVWIIFGAIAGWAAAKLAGDDRTEGCLTNIVIGVAGAVIGAGLYQLATGRKWDFGFNISSFVVAVIGAVVLLVVLRWIRD